MGIYSAESSRVALPKENIIEQASITTIAGNAQTTLVTYNNSGAGDIWVTDLIACGTADAEYEVQIDTVSKIFYRTSEMNRTMHIHFSSGLKISSGSILTIKVEHFDSFTADFDGSILGYKY